MSAALVVRGLEARLGDLSILKGVDLEVPYGEVHALMGPNGSGKSTLCHVLMGKPEYTATGSALVGGTEVLGLPVDARSRAGLFMGYQYPVEVPGVTLQELLDEMGEAAGAGPEYRAMWRRRRSAWPWGPSWDGRSTRACRGARRSAPRCCTCWRCVPGWRCSTRSTAASTSTRCARWRRRWRRCAAPTLGVLVITHYSRILRYMAVDRVHVMAAGRVVRSGDMGLAAELESGGYDAILREAGEAAPAPGGDDFLRGL